MFLLDTCVVSDLAKKRPVASVVHWVNSQSETELFLSAVSIGEIEEGVAALSPGPKRDDLFAWVRHKLPARFAGRILPMDVAVATAWGVARGESTATLPAVDGFIAATAQVHGLIVVTRNVADFRRFRVPVFNPWK